ncbi:MAG TPA: hypothetical protein VFE20_03530 [Thermoleophilia bacterium]|nr:hypothetical protein [Thermoleophilia bacterium]
MFRLGRNEGAAARAETGAGQEQARLRELPPIDLEIPEQVQTATFALG